MDKFLFFFEFRNKWTLFTFLKLEGLQKVHLVVARQKKKEKTNRGGRSKVQSVGSSRMSKHSAYLLILFIGSLVSMTNYVVRVFDLRDMWMLLLAAATRFKIRSCNVFFSQQKRMDRYFLFLFFAADCKKTHHRRQKWRMSSFLHAGC